MSEFKIGNRRYLGSKAKLLSFINDVITKECGKFDTFLDLFAGTGNVGRNFNNQETSVIVNDLLESNYQSYLSFFGSEEIDNSKILSFINKYNQLDVLIDNYFSDNFSDTFFSRENCRKIGFIREDIEQNFISKTINQRERAVLITSLLYAMDRIANTVGHYDAYRMNGDLSKKIFLKELDLPDSKINRNNKIFKEDANKLVETIGADVVYIDPPYNSRQYCDAYHLLENVALRRKPEVYGTARKMDRKGMKSKYCIRSASAEFDDLINKINAKYIIVSYNNTGTKGAGRSQAKISDEDIISILKKKGIVKVYETDYAQFTAGKSKFLDHKERLFVCTVGSIKKSLISSKSDSTLFAKSPLNYTGGKFKLLPQLIQIFPEKIDTFVDLFGGGFNVGANVLSHKTIYNDKNKEVVRIIKLFYKYSGNEIIEHIEKIIHDYNLSNSYLNSYKYYKCESDKGLGGFNKSNYIRLRNKYNSLIKEHEEKDFMLLTLIIYGFNNQIRFNSSNQFNMPVGKRDLNSSARKNIKEFASKVKHLELKIISVDFNKIDPLKLDKPFFYCDPPYLLGTATYNEGNGWSDKEEIQLLNYLCKLDELRIPFALSNVIEHKGLVNYNLKKWAEQNCFNVIYIKSDYSNSNYHIKDKLLATKEVLITNY